MTWIGSRLSVAKATIPQANGICQSIGKQTGPWVFVMPLACDVIKLYDITNGQFCQVGVVWKDELSLGCPLLDFIHSFTGEAHQTHKQCNGKNV